MQRVSIYTEITAGKGWGHYIRCSSIAEAFLTAGWVVEFFCYAENDPPIVGAISDCLVLCDWKRIKEFDNKKNVALVDSYTAPIEFYERLQLSVDVLCCLDDFRRLRYPTGAIILNYTPGEEKRAHYPGQNHLLGSSYAPIRQTFLSIAKKNKEISPVTKKVLITLGGDDPHGFTQRLLKKFQERKLNYEITVIASPSVIAIINSHNLSQSHIQLVSFASTEMMAQKMSDTDICICGGGSTLFELAALGVPSIAVGLAENQRGNLAAWKDHGILFAGWVEEAGIEEKVIDFLEQFKAQDFRLRVSLKIKALIDGNGSARIVSSLASHCLGKET